MSYLIIPSRSIYARRPAGTLVLNKSNPYGASVNNLLLYDWKRTVWPTQVNPYIDGSTPILTSNGLAGSISYSGSGISSSSANQPWPQWDLTGDFTFLVYFQILALSDWGRQAFGNYNKSNGDAGYTIGGKFGDGSDASAVNTSAFNASSWTTGTYLAAIVSSRGTSYLFRNGVQAASVGAVPTYGGTFRSVHAGNDGGITETQFGGNFYYMATLGRALTAAELLELTRYPWLPFLQRNALNRSFFTTAAGGGNTLTAPLGTLTLTGLVPTLGSSQTLTAPQGVMTLTGLVPVMGSGQQVDAPLGTLTLTGLVPTFEQTSGNTLTAPLGTLTITGLVPEIGSGHQVDAPLGVMTLTGLAPVMGSGQTVNAPLGTLTLTGFAPTMGQTNTLTAPLGTLTLTGLVPEIGSGHQVDAPLGTLTLTGFAPTFEQTGPQTMTAPLGVLTLTELVPTFQQTGTPVVTGGGSHVAAGGGKRGDPDLDRLFREDREEEEFLAVVQKIIASGMLDRM